MRNHPVPGCSPTNCKIILLFTLEISWGTPAPVHGLTNPSTHKVSFSCITSRHYPDIIPFYFNIASDSPFPDDLGVCISDMAVMVWKALRSGFVALSCSIFIMCISVHRTLHITGCLSKVVPLLFLIICSLSNKDNMNCPDLFLLLDDRVVGLFHRCFQKQGWHSPHFCAGCFLYRHICF